MGVTLTSKTTQRPFTLAQAFGIVILATIASSIFGLLRETLLAAKFGTTLQTDAYFFSFGLMISLPEFMLSAISASLIPIYIRSKEEGHSFNFVSTIINAYLLFLLIITALIWAFAPLIVTVLATGFDAVGLQTVIRMIRLLSPALILAGVWGLFKTLLNAEGEFFVSSISQSLLSIGIIGAIIGLSSFHGIFSLPVGILLGVTAQVAWTAYWVAKRTAFRYRLHIDLKSTQFRRFLYLLGPGLAGGLIGYFGPIIDRWFASYLPEGTIASLGFAGRLIGIITRVAVFSLVTALLPTLSWDANRDNREKFKDNVVRTIGILMFATIPFSMLMATLRVPIIQLLFEHGNFTAAATANTANIFAGLALGLMPMAIAVTLSTVFVSLEDTKTPAFFGAGSNLISKFLFNLMLVAPLGALGLALSTSMMYVVSGALLLILLRRRLHGFGGYYLVKTFVKVLLAAVLAVYPVHLIVEYSQMSSLAINIAGMLLGTSLYLCFSAFFRVPEFMVVQSYLLKLMRNGLFSRFLGHG